MPRGPQSACLEDLNRRLIAGMKTIYLALGGAWNPSEPAQSRSAVTIAALKPWPIVLGYGMLR